MINYLKKLNFRLTVVFLFFLAIEVIAQPQKSSLISIKVYPAAGKYDMLINEPIDFEVVVYKYGMPVPSGEIEYAIGAEQFESDRKSAKIKNGKVLIKGEALKVPGFYRCYVYFTFEGKEYQNASTVSVAKEKIVPTVKMPADFDAFWEQTITASQETPLKPKMEWMPEESKGTFNQYHISYHVEKGNSFFGILTIPKKEGKYPAKLNVPGAGVRPYYADDFEKDKVITLKVGVHGIPVNLYNSTLYQNLQNGALKNYWAFRIEDKEEYYYKRVILGCLKAVDFLHTLTQFDGETIVIQGGSQGGALSIITSSLDPRIDYLVAYYPALSDLTGYLSGRAGGSPHFFKDGKLDTQQMETLAYYDVVNFAKKLKIPGFYAFGYNDNVTPPTSVMAVLNSINSEKKILKAYDIGHFTYPEMRKKSNSWLRNQLSMD